MRYRRFNHPTPVIAAQILKDKEIAAALDKLNGFPTRIIKNHTRMPIYIYAFSVRAEYTKCIEPQESAKITYATPFEPDEIMSYLLTDHYYGQWIDYSGIDPTHILNFWTVEYGSQEETLDITKDHLSAEDKWRGAALKSQYLLHQLIRLGANHNPNYEPILDMVQDIEFPPFSEQDKERAGVTSGFTNVLETTGIDPPH
jgi:hypothetical protein